MFDNYFLEIVNGFRYVNVDSTVYKLVLPTVKNYHEATFMGSQAYQRAQFRMLPTEEDVELAIQKSFEQDDIAFLDHYEDIKRQTKYNIEIQQSLGKKQLEERKLERLDDRYNSLLKKKFKYQSMSAGGIRSAVETMYCFFRCVQYGDETFVWSSYDQFLDDEYVHRRNVLFRLFTGVLVDYDNECLRSIAKQAYYRSIWKSSVEAGVGLFSSFLEMSIPAIKLSYWISLYSNVINNSPEITDEVIEDDDDFDNFVKRLHDRMKNPQRDSGSSGEVIEFV